MKDPKRITFETLAANQSASALGVLLAALDVPDESIRELAFAAVLDRGSPLGHREMIQRYELIPPSLWERFKQELPRMVQAVEECLRQGDASLRESALEVIRRTECHQYIPVALRRCVLQEGNKLDEATLELVVELIDNLYDQLQSRKVRSGSGQQRTLLEQIVLETLSELDSVISRLDSEDCPDSLIEAVLVLGEQEHFAVRKLLRSAPAAYRTRAHQFLMTSTHAGVMQLICDAMGETYPHPKVFEAVTERSDPEFVLHLLRWFPTKLTATQAQNFRQIEMVSWLNSLEPDIEFIPGGLQRTLIRFLAATGLPHSVKMSVQEWLVRHGSVAGREAAGEVLESLDPLLVQKIVFEGLESSDPNEQAWATSQLRARKIPETFSLLIERLDSETDEVRDAARGELQSFNLERVMGMLEHLPANLHDTIGRLLKKIDPHCVAKLRRELASPIKRRRIQTARAALSLNLQDSVVEALTAMLEDPDSLVRRTAVEVLTFVEDEKATVALTNVLCDSSSRVREAAYAALDYRQEQAKQSAQSQTADP